MMSEYVVSERDVLTSMYYVYKTRSIMADVCFSFHWKGVVCIVCTLPGCEMVPYDDILANIRAKKEENEGDDATTKTKSDENTIVKKHSKTDKRSDPSGTKLPLWDAVETVRCILSGATCSKRPGKDTDPDSTDNDIGQQTGGQKEVIVIEKRMTSPPPGSRFISRILPMQATVSIAFRTISVSSSAPLNNDDAIFAFIFSAMPRWRRFRP